MNKHLKTSFHKLLKSIRLTFKSNNRALDWNKAIIAGLCTGFPVLIALYFNKIELGFLSAIGSYSYLYVANEPYAYRAKKILLIALGISLSVLLSTLVTPYPILSIIVLGLIGAIATFIFGLFKVSGAGALFFVFAFLMITQMSKDPSQALFRFNIVLASGLFSWFLSIIGWFFNRHHPEIKAFNNAFLSLASYSEAVGTNKQKQAKEKTIDVLSNSGKVLLAGYISWDKSAIYQKLVKLYEEANNIFLEMLKLESQIKIKYPRAISDALRKVVNSVKLKEKEPKKIELLPKRLDNEFQDIEKIIIRIQDIINNPVKVNKKLKIIKPSLLSRILKGINKDSLVFINALRYGGVLSISMAIAYIYPFDKPHWIPLSCAAVMLGSNIMSTISRTIQRSVGTIIGLFLAMVIITINPQGLLTVFLIIVFIVFIDLYITKNYVVATILITAYTILMSEIPTRTSEITQFVSTRILNILIGSFIGLLGTFFMIRRLASSRLLNLLVILLQSQFDLIVKLSTKEEKLQSASEKMNLNLMNFKLAYNTALGEFPHNEVGLEYLWPALYSLNQIAYLLNQRCEQKEYINISKDKLTQLLLVFERIVKTIEKQELVKPIIIPDTEEMPLIIKEINNLQEALSYKKSDKEIYHI